jgi:hypothetical protein
MWMYKRKKGTPASAVITPAHYEALPGPIRKRFFEVPEDTEPTHVPQVNDDAFQLLGIIDAEALHLGTESNPTENYVTAPLDPPDLPDQVDASQGNGEPDFGGGSGGGAGAGDSY